MNQHKNVALSPIDSQLRDWGDTKINGVHLFTPNLITLYGLILYHTGLILYFFFVLPGLILAVMGGLMDILDGLMSRVMRRKIKEPPEEWGDMQGVISATVEENGVIQHKVIGHGIRSSWAKLWLEITYPGGTHLGEVLDPHADKLKTIPSLVIFSALGIISPWLVGISVLPELVGTLMRRPLPLLKKWSHGQSATWVGKTKVYIQWSAIGTCIPIHQQLVGIESAWKYIPNALLILSIIFSFASVISRWGKKKGGREEVPDA